MVPQNSFVGKFLHWHVLENFVCYSLQLYTFDCSIRVTAVLEYIKFKGGYYKYISGMVIDCCLEVGLELYSSIYRSYMVLPKCSPRTL